MVIGGKLMRSRMTMLMMTTMTIMMATMTITTMMTRLLWWLEIQFWWFTDNHPTAYQCTRRWMIADARIALIAMWSFYDDNAESSDDNDLIVGENYCTFYDVVAKLQQGRECWEEWVSKSKCLNWSFHHPDLNVPPSKRLPEIAPDLQAHNFGALSDRCVGENVPKL